MGDNKVLQRNKELLLKKKPSNTLLMLSLQYLENSSSFYAGSHLIAHQLLYQICVGI